MVGVQMVKDKITLCREMLPETAGVDRDAAFSEVVGFLEVCIMCVCVCIDPGPENIGQKDRSKKSLFAKLFAVMSRVQSGCGIHLVVRTSR